MIDWTALFIIVLAVGVALFIFYFLFQKSIIQKIVEVQKDERERLEQERKSERDLISEKMQTNKTDLENKQETFRRFAEQIKQNIDASQQLLQKTEKASAVQFSTLGEQIKANNEQTNRLRETTENLKNILSNNQLRGQWGEEIAENLLQSVGFVKGQTYTANKTQSSTGTRPDFTLHFPDGTKLNIDVKFPYKALLKYHDAETETDKDNHMKEFKKAVRGKIDEVTSRGYINPEEKTVDFVILFIPNEMIFSFIYEHMNEVWDDAFRKKVVLAGPFGFTAILRIVFQSYKNFAYQKNTRNIIELIQVFDQEYQKFSDELEKLSRNIQSLNSQYEIVIGVRNRKLTTIVEKIKKEETPEKIIEETKKK